MRSALVLSNVVVTVSFRLGKVGFIFILSLSSRVALHKSRGIAASIFLLETALRILHLKTNHHFICKEILAQTTNPLFFLEVIGEYVVITVVLLANGNFCLL